MNKNRWIVERTPEGGISIGYFSLTLYRNCQRKLWWAKLAGKQGRGVAPPPSPPSLPLLYGKLWHAAYKADLLGLDQHEELISVLAEDKLDSGAYKDLLDDVKGDMEWYWNQNRTMKIKVLSCEEELSIKVGPHIIRGTPDLVAEIEADWGGGIYIPDNKTFVALSTTPTGSAKLTLKPRESTMMGHQHSRQFKFYAAVWNKLHPDQLCSDGLINMVPQQVNRILDVLAGRKGNIAKPEVVRDFIPMEPEHIELTWEQTVADVFEIADKLNTEAREMYGFSLDPLVNFRENGSACIDAWGHPCTYLTLCESSSKIRQDLLDGAFVETERE